MKEEIFKFIEEKLLGAKVISIKNKEYTILITFDNGTIMGIEKEHIHNDKIKTCIREGLILINLKSFLT